MAAGGHGGWRGPGVTPVGLPMRAQGLRQIGRPSAVVICKWDGVNGVMETQAWERGLEHRHRAVWVT